MASCCKCGSVFGNAVKANYIYIKKIKTKLKTTGIVKRSKVITDLKGELFIMKKSGMLLLFLLVFSGTAFSAARYIRVNQVGYLPGDAKVAVAFSNDNLSALTFSIIKNSDNTVVWGPTAFPTSSGVYSPFTNTYKLNFSAFAPAASDVYKIRLSDGTESLTFRISQCVYSGTEELILNFYLGQRCGTDNKYAGAHCHMQPGGGTTMMDGKVTGGGAYTGLTIDAEGGWHDSGDFIKFMITVGWSCETLLFSYQQNPSAFQDNLNANGTAGANGLPDVLDEAKYALDWIMKMNPDANTLFYQVGGSQDHNLGLGTLPQNDNANYATKPYRPVYYGNGSNTCGKAATCLALAYQIWNARGDTTYANTCLSYATRIYALGKSVAKIQNATPASFYTESDYNDDMEWAATEMYKATGTTSYLTDAKSYAASAGSAGGSLNWDSCNFLAHYSLYPLVDATTQNNLKGYMQSDLSSNLTTSNGNHYGMCTAYDWGSMETLTGGIVKGQLYKKLFSDTTYDNMVTYNRDYLLGKNPWGVCFIVGMGTVYPLDPQHNITVGLNIDIPGMPIEGPDIKSDWDTQGITLDQPDEYAAFQATVSTGGIYHDDVQDYASNEPTSTHAGLCVAMFSMLSLQCVVVETATCTPTNLSATNTITPTKTITKTATQTMTQTATKTATQTATQTPTCVCAGTVTQTATITETIFATATPSATQMITTQTATMTVTPTPVITATPASNNDARIINLYPNPVKDKFVVEYEVEMAGADVEFAIYTSAYRLVQKKNMKQVGGTHTLVMAFNSPMANGIYLLRYIQKGETQDKKQIVQFIILK